MVVEFYNNKFIYSVIAKKLVVQWNSTEMWGNIINFALPGH